MKWIIPVLLFPLLSQAGNRPDPQCEAKELGDIELRFCAYPTDRSKNPDLIYYIHGAGGAESHWHAGKVTEPLYDHWKTQGQAAPTVISISLKSAAVQPGWWVVSELPFPGGKRSYREVIEKELYPLVEKKFPLGARGRRMIMGASMGGYNTYELWAKSPHLYAKAAPLCAGLIGLSPYASAEELEAFRQKAGGEPKGWFWKNPVKVDALQTYQAIWQPFFQEKTSVWEKERAENIPITKAHAKTPLHFVYNLKDAFGVMPGNADAIAKLQSKGVNVIAETNEKGHCVDLYTPALADFLVSGPRPVNQNEKEPEGSGATAN